MKNNVIIIGGQKCGTTALFSYLSKHTDIVAAPIKETDFFNYDNRYKKGLKYYRSLYPKKKISIKSKIYLEASGSYLLDANPYITAERIYAYNPNVKLILLVRNPIYRAYSAFQMYKKWYYDSNISKDWWFKWAALRTGQTDFNDIVKRSKDDYNSFSNFIKREIDAQSVGKTIECGILKLGKYIDGLREYLKIFQKDQLKIIKTETMEAQTTSVLHEVSSFIGLKYYEWDEIGSKKIFKQIYDPLDIESEGYKLLEAYYKEPNKEFYKITEIDLNT